jgi:uncharacterized cupin superfamily protein
VTDIVNLRAPELDEAEEQPGYTHRRTQIGPLRGATRLGATIYEVPPGERLWPYHWELGCEEFAVVVSGSPTLRTPEGERLLDVGEIVNFPEGEPGTHQFRNDSDAPFRVLIGSTKSDLYASGYPDSGKLKVSSPQFVRMVRDEPLEYWDGEGTST